MNNTNPETTTLLSKLRDILGTIKKIIVHRGPSHADEIIAVALAEAVLPETVPVYRKDPDEDDLGDAFTLVLDVGGAHDIRLRNFDHHQLPRTADPACAFSLFAEFLGVDKALSGFFPWYDAWKCIDSKGPFAWAKQAGVDWETVKPLLSPVGDVTHRIWEKAEGEIPVNAELVEALAEQGRDYLEAADSFTAFCIKADEKELLQEFHGVPTLITSEEFTAEDSLKYADAYMAVRGVKGGVIVSLDNRGPGRAFFRRQDDKRIDFSRCAGKEYTSFSHPGGFILKTVSREKGMVCEVMDDAYVPTV